MSKKITDVFSGWFKEQEPQEKSVTESSLEDTTELRTSDNTAFISEVESTGTSFALDLDLGAPDPAYVAVVTSRIEESNLAGLDYFELRAATNKQIEKGLAKDQAFQSSFETLAAVDTSFTKALCLQSADHYLKITEGIQTDFDSDSNESIRLMEQKILDFKKNYDVLYDNLVKSFDSVDAVDPLQAVVDKPVETIISRLKKQEEIRRVKMGQVCETVKSQIEADKLIIQKL